MRLTQQDTINQIEERAYYVQHFMSFKTRTVIHGNIEEIDNGVQCALNFVVDEAYNILSHVSLERINHRLEEVGFGLSEIIEMEITPTDPNKQFVSNKQGSIVSWGDVHHLETQYDWRSIFNIFYNSTMQELRDFSFKYYDGQDSGPMLIIPHSEYLDTLTRSYYAENNVDDVFHDLKEHWNKDSIHDLIDRLRTISTRVIDR